MKDDEIWARIGEPVARTLLGEPNATLSDQTDLRWRRRGSLSLNRKRGMWFDFESQEGGGVVDLVMRELNTSRPTALQWLRNRGFLPPSPTWGLNTRSPATPASSSFRSQSPHTRAQSIWDQSQTVPMSPEHPARKWLARRHLWRPEVEVPGPLRWLPALERSNHSGSVIALVAPPEHWVEAWPSLPTPTGVQKLTIDDDGSPVLDRPIESGGRSKRSLGDIKNGVFMVGFPHEWSGPTTVAEGVADTLALAARVDGPAVAMMSAGAMKTGPIADWLASIFSVTIYADNDAGAGPAAAQRLRHAINVLGGNAQARFTGRGKDPAAAAAAIGFEELDERTLRWCMSFAAHLSDLHGWPPWESQRLAIVHITGGAR